MLYELIYCRLPFLANSNKGYKYLFRRKEKIKFPEKNISNEMKSLIRKMCCLDKNSRPTVKEILEDDEDYRKLLNREYKKV
jgi:serine/threonine protein kinase